MDTPVHSLNSLHTAILQTLAFMRSD